MTDGDRKETWRTIIRHTSVKEKKRRTYATVWDVGFGQSFALGEFFGIPWFARVGDSQCFELADGMGAGDEVNESSNVAMIDTHLKALAPACHSLPTSIFILTDL